MAITAIDTNVLLDLLLDSPWAEACQAALDRAYGEGGLVICDAVCAELAAYFAAPDEMDGFLKETGIGRSPYGTETLWRASRAWKDYLGRAPRRFACPACGAHVAACPACGRELRFRQHVLADFLVGAHAALQAAALLTRDAGYYRTYFPELRIVHPEVR